MPPLFAWPLAFMSSIALLLAAALLFGEPAPQSEIEGQGADETPEVTRQVGAVEQAVYLGLLIVPVGLIPTMARRKRVNGMRWSIAGVGVGFVYLMTQLPFLHPLIVLLALVYLRPQPPAASVAVADAFAPSVPETGGHGAVFVDTSPADEPAVPVRRRPLRRRRRPRY